MAAVTTVDVTNWKHRFAVLMTTLGSLFVRPEPRATASAYLLGLLSAVERKNSWWLAEAAGHASPGHATAVDDGSLGRRRRP